MKKGLILGLCFVLSGMVSAQEKAKEKDAQRQEQKEKMEAAKIAFITKELSLTPEEAQAFWPVYNQREAELTAVHEEMKAQHRNGKKPEEMSDEELKKTMAKQFELKQKMLDIEKKYHEEFLKVLPAQKVAKLYIAEHRFKREVLKQWKDEHEHGNQGQPKQK